MLIQYTVYAGWKAMVTMYADVLYVRDFSIDQGHKNMQLFFRNSKRIKEISCM